MVVGNDTAKVEFPGGINKRKLLSPTFNLFYDILKLCKLIRFNLQQVQRNLISSKKTFFGSGFTCFRER